MATLNNDGSEMLDQTPVALPLKYDRPEPIHQRIRRMILQAISEQSGDDVETLDDANDFEIPDDPSSYDTGYTEPDLEPTPQLAYTDEEIAAARAAVEKMRAEKADAPKPQDSANAADVSSSAADAEKPATE
nr:MAG: hypothetical protein [Microviridae sp.]